MAKLEKVNPAPFLEVVGSSEAIDKTVKDFVDQSPHPDLESAVTADDSRAKMLDRIQKREVIHHTELKAFLDLINQAAETINNLTERLEKLERK